MKTRLAFLLAVFAALAAMTGCAARSPGFLQAAPSGGCLLPHVLDTAVFEPVVDSALVARAARVRDSGGVRCASVFRLKPGKQTTVYRVYGGAGWRFGRWWTFSRPGSDSTAYREAFEICRGWNNLDSLAACEVRPSARFAIGPGQSAWCGSDPSYGVSDSLQVFFANPQQDLDTSRCTHRRMAW